MNAAATTSSTSANSYIANDSGTTESVWMGHVPPEQREPDRPALRANAACDVCVVGAGIAGLSVAYRLAKAGKKVIVLDDGPIAGAESGRTTGFLNTYPDDGLSRIAAKHDEQTARLAVDSFADAIDFIETLCRDEGIDARFERLDEYFFVDPQGDGQDFLDKEMDLAGRIGWNGLRFADRAPMPGVDTGRCVVFSNQAKFHAGRYLTGLAQAVEKHGGTIHNGTHVTNMTAGDSPSVETGGGHTVGCEWLITCTNSPVNPPFTDLLHIHLRQVPYRSYVVALEAGGAGVEPFMYSDTAEPYHYARLEEINGRVLLIVGGEDVITGHEGHDDLARFDRLEAWAKERWPKLGARAYAWSGQVFEPDDHLAFIGDDPGSKKKSLIATGDSGQGLTHGTLAGLILGDRVLGHAPRPYAKIYEPGRLALKAALEFAKTAAKILPPYADHLTPGEAKNASEIPPGTGRILRRGAGKHAVYRDEAGNLHECSAVCPHFGGIVQWNDMEKTWDCPIHGSRFAAEDGRCVTSPAISGLKKVSGE